MSDSKEVVFSKVDAFNKRNPVGSSVIVVNEMTVRRPAEVLPDNTPVVWLDDIPSCYHLDRVIG